jgi:hypothetical protein
MHGTESWTPDRIRGGGMPRMQLSRPVQRRGEGMAAGTAPSRLMAPTAAEVPEAAAAVRAAARGCVGLAPARPSRTRLPKWCPSRPSAKPLKGERRHSPSFETSSCVMHGMTAMGR